MEKVKNYTIEIIISIIGGLILFIVQQVFSLTVFISVAIIIGLLVIFSVIYLIKMHIKMRLLGIVDILDSQIEGVGSTKAFMENASQDVCFVGIAASKWVNESGDFENMIRRICARQSGEVRFLLLSPDSDAAHRLNVASLETNELSVQQKINNSLQKIDEIVRKLNTEAGNINYTSNFKVRLYSQMPVYRLAMIDHSCAFLSFYRLNNDGKKLKQLKILPEKKRNEQSNNIYGALAEYFENLWDSPETIEYQFKQMIN